jgi:sugar/nucleoside kinase (ribokinase family)
VSIIRWHALTSSPNHSEALSLLSMRPIFEVEPSLIKARLAEACVELARLGPRLAAIIRCGHLGCCYVSTRGATEPRAEDVRWVPAYWEVDGSLDKVVDPTGAGNAFMGGLGAALQLGKDMDEGGFPCAGRPDGQRCCGRL